MKNLRLNEIAETEINYLIERIRFIQPINEYTLDQIMARVNSPVIKGEIMNILIDEADKINNSVNNCLTLKTVNQLRLYKSQLAKKEIDDSISKMRYSFEKLKDAHKRIESIDIRKEYQKDSFSFGKGVLMAMGIVAVMGITTKLLSDD